MRKRLQIHIGPACAASLPGSASGGLAHALCTCFNDCSVCLFIELTAGRKHARTGEVARLPGNVVRIQWPRNRFEYNGGQYVFICVPAISLWEWHPFSLSSHPMGDMVTLHIRVLGDWTKQLYDLASQ